MANSYMQTSSRVSIPEEKTDMAREVIDRVTDSIRDEEGYVGVCSSVIVEEDETYVWLYEEESVNTDHLEKIVRALVEQLELDDVVMCSWAYTCSRPRIDEFGGGAFAVKRGRPTVWIDAATDVIKKLEGEIEYEQSSCV